MSSPTGSPWSDRRGMFQKGKEVHEPHKPVFTSEGVADAVRRASVSSTGSMDKTTSNTTNGGTSPTDQRRRSSTASGLFGNLTQHKRGSEDYSQRRASHSDQSAQGGIFGNWYQNTFKGAGKPAGDKVKGADGKRGVME
ncbi:hypothetical protein K461DRAFT_289383 [Myriangium duriaei CBS 260.36]|uniref:Uncharacterized protein n=1 Tax=Myriangium duriaei CBS 260.36 TaxID=1168546 RepID=A0A9P4JDI5_9PEZI|nr:hypothetical protein K461DRAFT_289383 [Myriangium duriaei CBS 260.36]